jgi:hypothetical protein
MYLSAHIYRKVQRERHTHRVPVPERRPVECLQHSSSTLLRKARGGEHARTYKLGYFFAFTSVVVAFCSAFWNLACASGAPMPKRNGRQAESVCSGSASVSSGTSLRVEEEITEQARVRTDALDTLLVRHLLESHGARGDTLAQDRPRRGDDAPVLHLLQARLRLARLHLARLSSGQSSIRRQSTASKRTSCRRPADKEC